ncbi:ECF transporter S component, partial [Bulleidia extructa]
MNTKRLTLMALMMALVIVLSSFSLPVPGGHLYLNDVVIVLASLLFSPTEAMLVCGFGAFLGDFFFYPAPMFVSLVTHG